MQKPRFWGRAGAGLGLGVALLAACSVDTSGITFVRDEAFDEGGVANVGGIANVGGVLHKGGVPNKGGSDDGGDSGSGGSSTAGSKQAGGGGGSGPSGGMATGGAGGTGGTGGMPMECPKVTGDPTQSLLDDVDEDPALPAIGGRVGGWYIATDMSPGATIMPPAAPNMPPLPVQPGASGGYAMRVSGGGFKTWGISLGLALLSPIRDAPACPYDLSRYSGLRFMLKGTVSDMIVRVQVPTVQTHQPAQGGTCDAPANGCGDHYGFDVQVQPDWQEVKVDFNELTQAGWGAEFPLSLREAINIEFHVGPINTFDVWVDDLSFY